MYHQCLTLIRNMQCLKWIFFLTSTLHTSCVLHWSTISFNNLESLSVAWPNIYLPVKRILKMKLLKSLWIFVDTFQTPPNGQKMIKRIPLQFARIHTSSLIKFEKILNRPITKFYNSDDVNVIAAELRLTKTRPASLFKRHNLL